MRELNLIELYWLRSLPSRSVWIHFEVGLNRRRAQNLLGFRLDKALAYRALGESNRLAMGGAALIGFLALEHCYVVSQVVILEGIVG
jgi:hypothetical protein